MLQNPHVLLTFGKMQNPLRLPRKTTSEASKAVRACGDFNILTWKCASCQNGMHFFDISSSKSVPNLVRSAHFDFEMCFAPQWRALVHSSTSQLPNLSVRCFLRLDFQKCFAPRHWKNTWVATFLPFRAPASSFLRLFLFSDFLSSFLFADSSHPCLSICPYCRKFDF